LSLPFEIRAPDIDNEALLRRARDRLEERRRAGQLPLALPDFGVPRQPELTDPTLGYHLTQANDTYNRICPDLDLAPSPVSHVPVAGWLWSFVRRHLHQLILYYLDRLASNQVRHNEHVVGVLNRLAALELENARLRQQVAELHEDLIPSSDHVDHAKAIDG